MDLITSMTIGAAASLSVSLLLRPIWSRFALRQTTNSGQAPWSAVTARADGLYLFAHAIAGASQGVLFWLSWGFAALSIKSWWLHGVIVGAAYAMLLVLPLLAICASVIRIGRSYWWVLMGEALLTCVAVGLACSWNWMHVR